jgi:hypothetical protein
MSSPNLNLLIKGDLFVDPQSMPKIFNGTGAAGTLHILEKSQQWGVLGKPFPQVTCDPGIKEAKLIDFDL